jgi:hypothetical protein
MKSYARGVEILISARIALAYIDRTPVRPGELKWVTMTIAGRSIAQSWHSTLSPALTVCSVASLDADGSGQAGRSSSPQPRCAVARSLHLMILVQRGIPAVGPG